MVSHLPFRLNKLFYWSSMDKSLSGLIRLIKPYTNKKYQMRNIWCRIDMSRTTIGGSYST